MGGFTILRYLELDYVHEKYTYYEETWSGAVM
jgi:hypothetical protein